MGFPDIGHNTVLLWQMLEMDRKVQPLQNYAITFLITTSHKYSNLAVNIFFSKRSH